MDTEKSKSSSPQPDTQMLLKATKSNEQSSSNTQANNPITRKLNKILESRIENDKVKCQTDRLGTSLGRIVTVSQPQRLRHGTVDAGRNFLTDCWLFGFRICLMLWRRCRASSQRTRSGVDVTCAAISRRGVSSWTRSSWTPSATSKK